MYKRNRRVLVTIAAVEKQ